MYFLIMIGIVSSDEIVQSTSPIQDPRPIKCWLICRKQAFRLRNVEKNNENEDFYKISEECFPYCKEKALKGQ
ncbi:UNVERIFIED_CONTAM: hypothetical protein RMT77_014397 [Armadillidium vulgare]